PMHTRTFGDDRPRYPPGQRDEHLPGDGAFFVREPCHDGRDELRVHRRVGRGVDARGHSRHRGRHDHVALHTIGGTLECRDISQPDYPGFGGRVVGHMVVAVQAAYRRGEHYSPVTGRRHDWKCLPHNVECAAQVHVEHRVEVLVAQFFQRTAANVAGVVDQDVDATVVVQRGLHDCAAAFGGAHRVSTGDGLPACRADLADHLLGGPGVHAITLQPPA